MCRELPYDGAAHRRVVGRVGAARVHTAVPGEEAVTEGGGLGGEVVEGTEVVQERGRGGEMGVGVDRGHVGGGPALPAGEQLGDAVGAVRRGELDTERFGRAALVGHDGDAVGEPGTG